MFARYRHAGSMNDLGVDALISETAHQPETIAARFASYHDTIDLMTSPQRLVSPAQKGQLFLLIG